MIPNSILLCSLVHGLGQLSSERFHPATDVSWSRDPESNISQTSGNPTEDGEEALYEPDGTWMPQDNSQNQITWAHN